MIIKYQVNGVACERQDFAKKMANSNIEWFAKSEKILDKFKAESCSILFLFLDQNNKTEMNIVSCNDDAVRQKMEAAFSEDFNKDFSGDFGIATDDGQEITKD